MEEAEALAGRAALLADRTRAAFCLALLDGRAWTPTELARAAKVAVSTASGHLDRLVDGGLLTEHRQGRHRYVQLAGPETAAVIEMIAAAGGTAAERPRSMAAAHRQRNLRFTRTCYDHLAGVAGVALADGLIGNGLIGNTDGLVLTGNGRAALENAGIEIPRRRRPALRECIDWTERRPHLAGEIGAAICRHAFGAGWITRIGSGRAVRVTPAGVRDLDRYFGVVIGPAEPERSAAAPAGPAGARRP
ncbi:winged helix-turn-helix domain-containing protein [Actinoplanes sp. NPDC051411]|uniref:winged helix-turn-helix domain-containing protein n=1 Tax=Actinoplanes sp. NPDC051411 TaxID=3155522 RepID=UPI00343752C3